MTTKEMEEILRIGVLLSEKRNLNQLLQEILDCMMKLAHCDAGTLYLKEGDYLHFRIMRTISKGICVGGDGQKPDMKPVPLRKDHVCAYAFLKNKVVSITDVKNSKKYDFSGPAKYDKETGYDTRSMLVVPMYNQKQEGLGVLQLINAMDADGHVCAFSKEMELILQSVASQAAIAIQNVQYMGNIKELFWSFVRVMSTAINKRTPYNVRHSEHMAACAERFMEYLEKQKKRSFSPEQREELLISIWLHDIGKVITPLKVMDKEKRLLPEQKVAFSNRMGRIALLGKIDFLMGKLTKAEKEERLLQIHLAEQLVDKINNTGYLKEEMKKELEHLAQKTYTEEDGSTLPWLTEEEYAMLSIERGTLSQAERKIMEEHVLITADLLGQIPFSSELSHVREWASSHHEFLNGTGYPRHLKGDEIPYEVRMMTILDIYDSLVADDRPYKPAKAKEDALHILELMAEKEGKLDRELVRLFSESKCWDD